MRWQRAFFLVVLFSLFHAKESPGQGIDRNVSSAQTSGFGFGARALGMGGAFIAIADDASAASWNPGGLGQLIHRQVTLSGSLNSYETATTGDETLISLKGGEVYRRVQDDTALFSQDGGIDFASFVQPVTLGERTVTLALAYTKQGRSGESSQDIYFRDSSNFPNLPDLVERPYGQGEIAATITGSGGLDIISLGIATGFLSKLFLGASVNYFRGEVATTGEARFRGASLRDESGAPHYLLTSDYIESDFSNLPIKGLSANLGILYKPSAWLSAGLVYRSGWSSTENHLYRLRNRGYDRDLYPDGRVYDITLTSNESSTIEFPQSFGAGIAVRPYTPLTLSVDVTWTQWSRGKITNFPRAVQTCANPECTEGKLVFVYGDVAYPSESPREANLQEDQVALRLGAEYVFRPGRVLVPVRVGAYRTPAIAPLFSDRVLSADQRVFDTDPHTPFTGLTAGVGVVLPVGTETRLLVDFAGVVEDAASGWNMDVSLTSMNGEVIGRSQRTSSRQVTNKRFIGSLILYF